MAQLSIFRFYYVWSMLSREEHFNSNQEEYKEAFLLRVLHKTVSSRLDTVAMVAEYISHLYIPFNITFQAAARVRHSDWDAVRDREPAPRRAARGDLDHVHRGRGHHDRRVRRAHQAHRQPRVRGDGAARSGRTTNRFLL